MSHCIAYSTTSLYLLKSVERTLSRALRRVDSAAARRAAPRRHPGTSSRKYATQRQPEAARHNCDRKVLDFGTTYPGRAVNRGRAKWRAVRTLIGTWLRDPPKSGGSSGDHEREAQPSTTSRALGLLRSCSLSPRSSTPVQFPSIGRTGSRPVRHNVRFGFVRLASVPHGALDGVPTPRAQLNPGSSDPTPSLHSRGRAARTRRTSQAIPAARQPAAPARNRVPDGGRQPDQVRDRGRRERGRG